MVLYRVTCMKSIGCLGFISEFYRSLEHAGRIYQKYKQEKLLHEHNNERTTPGALLLLCKKKYRDNSI